MTTGKTIRVVSREADGSLRVRDYDSCESVCRNYDQVGIDDCSTDLSLRGLPVLKGLVGPFPDGRRVARYETPDVFEIETRQWASTKTKRRSATKAPIPACHFDSSPAAATIPLIVPSAMANPV